MSVVTVGAHRAALGMHDRLPGKDHVLAVERVAIRPDDALFQVVGDGQAIIRDAAVLQRWAPLWPGQAQDSPSGDTDNQPALKKDRQRSQPPSGCG